VNKESRKDQSKKRKTRPGESNDFSTSSISDISECDNKDMGTGLDKEIKSEAEDKKSPRKKKTKAAAKRTDPSHSASVKGL
jgi:hypothetical protein